MEIGGRIPGAGAGAVPVSPSSLRFARAASRFSLSSSRSSACIFSWAMVGFFAEASGLASGAAVFATGRAPMGGSTEPSFLGARFLGASPSSMSESVSAFFAGAVFFAAGGGVTSSPCSGAAPLGLAARVPGLESVADFEVGLEGMEKVACVEPCVSLSGFAFEVVG